jgi:hypothetical protein
VAQDQKTVELTIQYSYEDIPLTGAVFQIYRIGGVDPYGNLYLDGSFKGYAIDLNVGDTVALAEIIYGYAMMDRHQPEYTVTIDETGTATQSGMPQGVYLITGLKHADEVHEYLTEPQLVILPAWNEAGEWVYSTVVNPKGSVEVKPVSIKVLKIWEDEGYEEMRPESITVTLLQDGIVYETVSLKEENNWRHTWAELPGGYLWTVVETVPENYVVQLRQEGITYLIINTYDAPEPPPTEPEEPTEPSDPTEPSQPTDPTEPSEPEVPEVPELPETGLLWWPVPVMAMAGLVLVILGMAHKRGGMYEA